MYLDCNTFAIIEFDIHETIFIFWQPKYILQKYYFGGGQKFIHVSYNDGHYRYRIYKNSILNIDIYMFVHAKYNLS